MDKLDIETYKSQFIDLLKSTGREGIDDLIEMLDEGKMHFFTAPASVNHHLNSDGGRPTPEPITPRCLSV